MTRHAQHIDLSNGHHGDVKPEAKPASLARPLSLHLFTSSFILLSCSAPAPPPRQPRSMDASHQPNQPANSSPSPLMSAPVSPSAARRPPSSNIAHIANIPAPAATRIPPSLQLKMAAVRVSLAPSRARRAEGGGWNGNGLLHPAPAPAVQSFACTRSLASRPS
jgi:hypothetical protein